MMLFLCVSCKSPDRPDDYRIAMRTFVEGIADYARTQAPEPNAGFIVIPQNGQPVAWSASDDDRLAEGKSLRQLDLQYLHCIDGTGREDTYYGYYDDDDPAAEAVEGVDVSSGPEVSGYFESICDVYKANGVTVLSIDYCDENKDAARQKNDRKGYVSYCAPSRNLDVIPQDIYRVHSDDVTRLNQAQNFLFFLNYEGYTQKSDLLTDLKNSNYDVLIIDACFNDGSFFTKSDIASLKEKANGGKRLVICYMSIGEAEDYRWYWNSIRKMSFVEKENPDWEGNYKVCYWDRRWQNIIYGNPESYTARILNAGFDGVYLDIIDAYEYFEEE